MLLVVKQQKNKTKRSQSQIELLSGCHLLDLLRRRQKCPPLAGGVVG